MSTTAQGGEVHSMGASKQEALRALLNSLVPNGQMALPDDANVDKLTEKLDELLASKGGIDAYTNIPRDDQGRPLNEEGLPIMEIMEPVANTNESSVARPSPMDTASSSMSMLGQAPLSPLPNWALSPAALAARRRERDRILDILEREEEAEFARTAAATHEPTNRSLDTVSPPVPATPLHALDQAFRTPDPNSSFPSGPSVGSSNEESSRPSGDFVAPASQGYRAIRKPKKQKSVSFVDPPSNDQDDRPHSPKPELDWGDVIPVRLDSRKPGLTKGHGVMKDLVVERPRSQSSAIVNRVADSDDEDEEPNEEHDVPEDEDSETEVPKEALGQLETSDDESDVDREENTQRVDVDDTDFDEAMLQREIALAYYARRNQMGADISTGPLSNPTSMGWVAGRDGEDEPAGGVMETNSTWFRGSRLPGNPQTLVNSVVQFGRLVDGELVVNETADKAVESSIDTLTGGPPPGQEDMTERMIELLRRGDTHPGSDPMIIEPNPSIKKIPRETSTSGSRPPVSESIPPRSTTSAHRSKRHSNPANPAPSLVSRTSSQRQVIPPPPTNDRPMIIESGFGFDPAFQVAPPPKPNIAKTPAPMSEIVQERAATPSPAPTETLEKKRSRFAQARAPGQFPASQQITSSTSARVPTTIGSDVVEQTPNPPSVVKNSEPPKRMSRFRAERSGWM
ncbi:hypothetical protein ACGC1H_002887 [Rhizoctonia solani]|uniref:DUF3835 domain-containing protein n=1 Tax=Rhizoctonia solani TaxID=456999 RepID=A0A8H2XUY7_9AGAM|nr:unnamed protein product [Rhizoctonia solani]